jgi:hypothetical protein
MNRRGCYPSKIGIALLALAAWGGSQAEAGGWLFKKRSRTVVPTPTATVRPLPPPNAAPLGTFYPTPYMTVRGNFPTGGGYSPGDTQGGDQSMDIYGPLSAFRATSAPVLTYVRGYDGRGALVEGTSFSTPNLAGSTPVVYPTQGTYYYGFRHSDNPPWWPKAINWIDQN